MITPIIAFLSNLWSSVGKWVLGAGAILATIAAAFLTVKGEGEDQQKASDTEDTLKSVKEAHDVEDKVSAVPGPVQREQLQSIATDD